MRHAADGGHVVSVYRVHAEAGTSTGGSDRARSKKNWAAVSGGNGIDWRQPQYAAGIDPSASSKGRTRLSQCGASRNEGLDEGDGRARDAARQANEASSRRLGVGQTVARRCDCELRQRHDRDLVGETDSSEARANAFSFGHAGDHGAGASLHDCGASGVSGAAVRRVRGRWRLLDANGGFRDRGEVPATD